jgi:hypothetical protein
MAKQQVENLQVGKMARLQNGRLMKRQVGKMAG